jgi:hypothetical protein
MLDNVALKDILGKNVGHRVTAVIYLAAKLGIADLLTERPRTAVELA